MYTRKIPRPVLRSRRADPGIMDASTLDEHRHYFLPTGVSDVRIRSLERRRDGAVNRIMPAHTPLKKDVIFRLNRNPINIHSAQAFLRRIAFLFSGSWRRETIEVAPAPAQWLHPFAVGWIGQDDPLLPPNRDVFVHRVLARLDRDVPAPRAVSFSILLQRSALIEISQVVADVEQNRIVTFSLLASCSLIASSGA